jgi:serine protease Do
MDNNNEFNYSTNSTESSFKAPKEKKQHGGFGKAVVVPFFSGIVGASLVVGTCFGVPSIKQKLIKTSSVPAISSQTTTSSSSSIDVVNLADFSDTSIGVAQKVLPSIVGITVKYNVSSFFGSSTAEATGSGIIISSDGYIVTNNHVISSESSSSSYYAITEATGITVNLYNDETEYTATVVGTDAYTDLAVIKIDATDLTAATLGNSDEVQVGEFAMAIGNPLGMDSTVTSGIISAVNREVESEDGTTYTAIQTDAAINSGNSGGALVNSKGEVIGINTLKLSGTGIEGIGFAIPISSTTNVISQLIEYNTVKRPSIGISVSDVSETVANRYNIPVGIYVESVTKDGPADKAGLASGDIITKINNVEVKTTSELNKIKNQYSIGDEVTLTVYSNNNYKDVTVKLGEEEQTEASSTSTTTQNNSSSSTQQVPSNPYSGGSSSGSIFDYFFN